MVPPSDPFDDALPSLALNCTIKDQLSSTGVVCLEQKQRGEHLHLCSFFNFILYLSFCISRQLPLALMRLFFGLYLSLQKTELLLSCITTHFTMGTF